MEMQNTQTSQKIFEKDNQSQRIETTWFQDLFERGSNQDSGTETDGQMTAEWAGLDPYAGVNWFLPECKGSLTEKGSVLSPHSHLLLADCAFFFFFLS